MAAKRFFVEQIVAAKKQQKAGSSAAEMSRKIGIAEGIFLCYEKEI